MVTVIRKRRQIDTKVPSREISSQRDENIRGFILWSSEKHIQNCFKLIPASQAHYLSFHFPKSSNPQRLWVDIYGFLANMQKLAQTILQAQATYLYLNHSQSNRRPLQKTLTINITFAITILNSHTAQRCSSDSHN
jgi:hypothetical protein